MARLQFEVVSPSAGADDGAAPEDGRRPRCATQSEAMTNPAMAQARFQLSCHSQGKICQGGFLTGMADAVMAWQISARLA
jgi:hypothetical protein